MLRSSCHDNLTLVSVTSLSMGFVGAPGNIVKSGGGRIGFDGFKGMPEKKQWEVQCTLQGVTGYLQFPTFTILLQFPIFTKILQFPTSVCCCFLLLFFFTYLS